MPSWPGLKSRQARGGAIRRWFRWRQRGWRVEVYESGRVAYEGWYFREQVFCQNRPVPKVPRGDPSGPGGAGKEMHGMMCEGPHCRSVDSPDCL